MACFFWRWNLLNRRTRTALATLLCLGIGGAAFGESLSPPRLPDRAALAAPAERSGLGNGARPTVRLARPGPAPDWTRLPASAPVDYEAAAALDWIDAGARLALDFGAHAGRPGFYTGPEGGVVYQWERDQYQWKRADGAVFTRWKDGGWKLEVGGHALLQHGGGHPALSWTFPDGVELRRAPHPGRRGERQFFYLQTTRAGPVAYELLRAPAPHYRTATVGPYRLVYDPGWQGHVDRLRSFSELEQFFAFAAESLGFRNAGPIPGLLVRTLPEMRAALGNPAANAGGVGGLFGLTMCCSADRPAEENEPTLREARARAESFHVLLHETVHNLQQHRCAYVRAGGSYPEPQHPGDWFVEGVADYVVMQIEPRSRVWMLRQLYERLDQNTTPRFGDLDYRNLNAYIFGRAMLQYLANEKGPQRIGEYYDHICRGDSPAAAMQKAAGMAPDRLYSASLEYFRAQRAQLEAQFFDWELHGLFELDYVQADAARPGDEFTPPADLFAVRTVPDFFQAYRLNLGAFRGSAYEGLLRTSDGRKVYLWRGAVPYSVETRRTKAFVRDEEVSLHVGGHVLINWANGQRRWVFPDGRYFHMWSADQAAGYFDKNGRPIQP